MPDPPPSGDPSGSPVLAIVLTDGFTGQEVVVRVQGAEVFRKTVHTDQRVGVARALDPIARDGPVLVEARVSGSDLSASAEVPGERSHVTVALLDGTLQVVSAAEGPYGYA